MSWKRNSPFLIGCMLAFGAVCCLPVVGQQTGEEPGQEKTKPKRASGSPVNPTGSSRNGGFPNTGGLPPGAPDGVPGFRPNVQMVPITTSRMLQNGQVVTETVMRPVGELNKPNEDQQELRDSLAKLRDPKGAASEKADAKAVVEKFLTGEFERDQKVRREHIERLEEQVATLRKQLEKREESKSKIVELRMQLLENDVEGLSFPESFNQIQQWGNQGHWQHLSSPNPNYPMLVPPVPPQYGQPGPGTFSPGYAQSNPPGFGFGGPVPSQFPPTTSPQPAVFPTSRSPLNKEDAVGP